MTKQLEGFQRIIEEIKSNNPQEEWSDLIKNARGVSASVEEVLTPCNIKSSKADQEHAEIILKDDNNYIVRYLRHYPTVGLATVPIRNKDGGIIGNMDWVRKRVICAGIPYACMIAFMHQEKLLVGWSKRIEMRHFVETNGLHTLFKDIMHNVSEASDGYDSLFAKFTDELVKFLTYQEPKDIELAFSKKGGKTAAIIRGLNDSIDISENNSVRSKASGIVPSEIAKNLRWFVEYAERTYGGKALNVGYPEFVPAVAKAMLPAAI